MRREILNGIPDDEKEAVKTFVDHNKESALKVKPKVSVGPAQFVSARMIASCRVHSKHPTPFIILIITRHGNGYGDGHGDVKS